MIGIIIGKVGKTTRYEINTKILNYKFFVITYFRILFVFRSIVMNKILKGFAIMAVLMVLPILTGAQPTVATPTIKTTADVFATINSIITLIMSVVVILAVIVILYAAYLYITAKGDPKNIDTAKTAILYAVIAVVIVLIAKGIIMVVANILGGTVTV